MKEGLEVTVRIIKSDKEDSESKRETHDWTIFKGARYSEIFWGAQKIFNNDILSSN